MSSFSLTGASFAFSGLSPVECSELSAVIQAHGGRVVDAVAAQSPEDVYVITDYCAQTSLNPSDRFVTRFWFSEMLRLRRWLRPDAHPFFEPPPKATALQHPITLTGDDGDVKMDTLSHHKMQLPHSSTSRFRDQVPVWPYFAAYLAQPMHNVQDLAAALHLSKKEIQLFGVRSGRVADSIRAKAIFPDCVA
ncbi:hypothetical protein PHYBOEH_001430 [Phytophthora boehmeriae]|uniref:BRCT domain-containing protein n=1 Tax=Phytophthora boehmeriae TaxID=109152 RepID=A0A8T1XAU9_9STRA|nr:hypothetical protein PHYBOEH_001430 [Phytophthora boehmeriae]